MWSTGPFLLALGFLVSMVLTRPKSGLRFVRQISIENLGLLLAVCLMIRFSNGYDKLHVPLLHRND